MNMTRHRFIFIYLLAIFIFNPYSVTAFADDFHDAPYNFLFGNHIDTHQETKIKIKRGHPVSLKGFFFTSYLLVKSIQFRACQLPVIPAVPPKMRRAEMIMMMIIMMMIINLIVIPRMKVRISNVSSGGP